MTTRTRNSVARGAWLLGLTIFANPAHAGGPPGHGGHGGGPPPGHHDGRGGGGHHGNGHGDDGHHGDDEACEALEGAFSSTVDPSPGCTSPVGFCTIGELTGDIVGTYAFTMDTMVPVSEDPAETTFTFSGQLTFSGDFAFLTFVRAVSGDECFEDVSGSLLATGHLDLVTGVTSGTWTADLCGVEDCLEADEEEGSEPGNCR